MWLPTKGQVDAVSRHAITAAGVVIAMLGLQAKGVDVAQVSAAIQALGSTVNDLLVLGGTVAGVYAALKASKTASPVEQAKSVVATGAQIVGSQALADATPGEPNIMSNADTKVVAK